MSWLAFLMEASLISLSGVMAPGPLTTVTVGKGSESPHVGGLVAIGHGIVEFPLMIFIFYGLGGFLTRVYVRAAIALVGGLFLLLMGLDMFRSIKRSAADSTADDRSPVLAGVLLSAGNPYFLVWWATVGATLISRSMTFGWPGFASLAAVHWLCDLGWLYFLSVVSFRGGQFLGRRFQRVLFALCGGFLLFFGGKFIADAVSTLFM